MNSGNDKDQHADQGDEKEEDVVGSNLQKEKAEFGEYLA